MANENKTVEQLCEEFGKLCEGVHVNSFGYIEDMTQTDACNFIDDILAAHKRELAAKDAEIAKRDALINELADKLACILACDRVYRDGADCYKKCPEESRQMCGRGKTCMLVAKAREVCK